MNRNVPAMNRLLVSATRKSSGKTLLTLGLCRALAARGDRVQPFKKGPDYIDPIWLSAAARRPCYNLDFNTMERDEILSLFGRHAAVTDISLVEGNKGLFDGLDPGGADCNAALATLLGAPVLLVIDVEGMTRGVAPLINGYRAFDSGLHYAGVVLNNYAGERHLAKLRSVIEAYTDVAVVGAVPRSADLAITERHLGLTTRQETGDAERLIERIACRVAESVNVDAIVASARAVYPLSQPPSPVAPERHRGLRIGIPRDEAFCFYYPDDLDELCRQGAEPVFFDALRDTALPQVDGLFIGGGFPETQAVALEANRAMRAAVRRFVRDGGPVYAECGGLMYLSRAIHWRGRRHEMVGAVAADTRMEDRPVGRGYVVLEPTEDHPWSVSGAIPAHEFHFSRLEAVPPGARFGLRVTRGVGIDGQRDGLVQDNLFAAYAHQRHTRRNPWITAYLDHVEQVRADRDACLKRRTATA